MEVTDTKLDEVAVVALKGRVDAANSTTLEQKLLGLLAGGEKRLVLELSGLEYISSAGLRVLLVVAKKLNAAGGKFALAAARDHIREVLDLSGFIDIFPLFANQQEAVAGVK